MSEADRQFSSIRCQSQSLHNMEGWAKKMPFWVGVSGKSGGPATNLYLDSILDIEKGEKKCY